METPICASGEPFSVPALLLTQKNLNSLSENSVHFTQLTISMGFIESIADKFLCLKERKEVICGIKNGTKMYIICFPTYVYTDC